MQLHALNLALKDVAGKVGSETFDEINRGISRQEYHEALEAARAEGLYRFD